MKRVNPKLSKAMKVAAYDLKPIPKTKTFLFEQDRRFKGKFKDEDRLDAVVKRQNLYTLRTAKSWLFSSSGFI